MKKQPLSIQEIIQHPEVYVYGGGTTGADCVSLLQEKGAAVRGVLDYSCNIDNKIHGVAMLRPDDFTVNQQTKQNALVIVGVFNAYVFVPDLMERLSSNGWVNTLSFLDFHSLFSAELGDRYWLTSRSFYDENEEAIKSAQGIWADSKSTTLFESVVKFRKSGDYNKLPPVDFDCQYFPPDIPAWSNRLRIVDCGAFDGDTIRQMENLSLSVDAYAGFEPDQVNYKKLAGQVAETKAVKGARFLWPCGVWSHCHQVKFASGTGTSSAISQDGDATIQCVAIDEALHDFSPNLIKMDIEGAEYMALLGASRCIQQCRPGLAICLYHLPDHLWTIPLLVKSWNLGYDIYLRCHCYGSFELVLYAIPNTVK